MDERRGLEMMTSEVPMKAIRSGPLANRAAAAAALAVTVALGMAGYLPATPAGATGEQIVVTTDPPVGDIRPHGGPSAGLEPDKLIVEVKDASGRNIPNVKLDVQLDTPPTNWFISTDVPRIEGHTVLNWSGVSADGRQEIQYAFPIRGAYHVKVSASPAPGASASFSALTRDTELTIHEKGKSYLYLAAFLAALFAFGAISGVVLGRANAAARRG
jgi:hypothetical protein